MPIHAAQHLRFTILTTLALVELFLFRFLLSRVSSKQRNPPLPQLLRSPFENAHLRFLEISSNTYILGPRLDFQGHLS